jgi:hypothetical protein
MKTELPRNAGFILAECPGDISRSNITLHGGFTGATFLEAGTVLGKLTSGGKFVKSPNSGSDGSQTAVAILAHFADISAGDVAAAVIDQDASVIGDALVYDSSVDDPTKKAAKVTQLLAKGIKVR